MTARLLTATLVALAVAVPAAAQDNKGPALSFQAQPLGKLLDDAKAMVRAVAGDEAVKEMEKGLKDTLGEKGFSGVDLLRPIVGYSELDEKAEASGAVVVFPITDEKEFLDLLGRMKVQVEEVKDARGLYRLTPREGGDKSPTALRFKDRHAYVGFNVPDAKLAADKLVPPGGLTLPTDNALFAYRVHLDRIPEGLRKQGFEAIDKAVAELKNAPGGAGEEAVKAAAESFARLYKRLGEQVLTEGDTAFFRLRFDQPTAEVALETALTGKKGSKLAADIAARKPATNRFAGLLTDQTAGGFTFEAPLFAPAIGEAVVLGIDKAADDIRKKDPPPQEYKALFDEVMAGLSRTAKSGDFDAAGALTGPDQAGLFTAAVAFSYEDTAKLETILRDLYKNAPEEVRNMIKLDDAKAGDVAIHRVAVGLFLPPEVKKVFGDKASVCVALAPKGVYVTFGPAAVEAMKAALAAKPAEARALDLVINASRLHKLATAIDPQAGQQVAQFLGTEDMRVSALSASVEGGEELRLRFALSLKVLPRAIGTFFSAGAAGAKPAPAAVPIPDKR